MTAIWGQDGDTRRSRPSYLAEPGLPGTTVIQPDVHLQRYTRRLVIGIGPPYPLDLRRNGAVVLGPVITAGRTEQFPLSGVALPDHAVVVNADRLQPDAHQPATVPGVAGRNRFAHASNSAVTARSSASASVRAQHLLAGHHLHFHGLDDAEQAAIIRQALPRESVTDGN
jgi:hypothetical protein